MLNRRLVGSGFFLLVLVIGLIMLVNAFQSTHWAVRRASGGNDVWEIWHACIRYAAAHDGRFPPLDKEPGRLMFDRVIMHDQYGITGKSVTMEYDKEAPIPWEAYQKDVHLAENKDLIDDHSWWYLGYPITNEEEGFLFVRAYVEKAFAKNAIEPDLLMAGKDMEPLQLPASLLTEITATGSVKNESLAQIPVFIERPGHYKGDDGGWVQYLDGHREFIEYPGRFPMTPQFMNMLRLIDALEPVFKSR